MNGSIEGGADRLGRSGTVGEPVAVRWRHVGATESATASRTWWDRDADRYLGDHGEQLGDVRLQWGPEGLSEDGAGLLGPVTGRRVLEVGCGAGQGARWLQSQGALAVGVDVSERMLQHAARLDEQTGLRGSRVQGDALRLPFRDEVFDAAFSAYGALPFLPDLAPAFAEVARVLVPAGRWVFSLTHPFRWCFKDDPGPTGLVAVRSYFDRRAYVEEDRSGVAAYVEHHHTLGECVQALTATGFSLERLLEPEWSPGTPDWGAWSAERGRLLPGTAVFVTRRVG